jgi:hexosaminidase
VGQAFFFYWWYPQIKGAMDRPEENTTIYATTRIWRDTVAWKDFWIGFNNLSRSTATDPPPQGAWDERQSAVWVNGTPIPPPLWKHGGQKGNAEIPLTDEGYEYRAPTKVYLKKGWNTVWIKAPVGSFKGRDWQNPVKWMFTCVPLAPNISPKVEIE